MSINHNIDRTVIEKKIQYSCAVPVVICVYTTTTLKCTNWIFLVRCKSDDKILEDLHILIYPGNG